MDLIEARKLATALIDLHLPGQNWDFDFNRRASAFGMCSYRKHTIYLSKILTPLNTVDHVTQTILHEIAHAKVGAAHRHDYIWKAAASRLGVINPKGSKAGVMAPPPEPRHRGTCPSGHIIMRVRKQNNTTSCARCSIHFDPTAVFTWVDTKARVR